MPLRTSCGPEAQPEGGTYTRSRGGGSHSCDASAAANSVDRQAAIYWPGSLCVTGSSAATGGNDAASACKALQWRASELHTTVVIVGPPSTGHSNQQWPAEAAAGREPAGGANIV